MRAAATATALGLALAGCGIGSTPAPRAPGLAGADWSTVTRYLDSAVADGAAPGAVLGVSLRGRRFIYGTGRLGQDDPSRPDDGTLYDLASLTKVVGLTTAVMLAVERHRLDLDDPVQRYVPAFRGEGKAAVTIRHLLTHSSGLPAGRPLYRETATRDQALRLADTTPLETLPGTRYVYSDLGAIVLTQAVEQAWGQPLDRILAQQVFLPLGMDHTMFRPPVSWRDRIAPTEDDPWRGRVLRGEVHDENAARLEGISGHAGLFSTAPDLLQFGEWLLAGVLRRPPCPAPGGAEGCVRFARPPPALAWDFVQRQGLPPGWSRALGWDTPSGVSSAGRFMSAASFGHTGFTGTSIWIDPKRELIVVLLTNRVHPTRNNSRIAPLRRGLADRIVLTVDPAASERASP